MPPLLWLLLLGGGAVLVTKALGGGGGMRGGPAIKTAFWDPRLENGRLETVKKEKFEDPLYLVFGGDKPYTIAEPPRPELSQGLPWLLNRWTMDPQQPNVRVGYEYLSDTRNEAGYRVARMRAMIDERKATRPYGPSTANPVLSSFVDASRTQLKRIAESLARTYRKASEDAAAAKTIAAELHVTPESLIATINDITSSTKQDYALLAKTVEKYGPMAKAIIGGVTSAIDIASTSGDMSRAVKVFDAAADAALLIPAYGPLISAGINVMGDVLRKAIEENKAECLSYQNQIKDHLQASMRDKLFPVPFHATQIFSLDCGEDYVSTEDQRSLLNLLEVSSMRFDSLPASYRIDVIKWWGLALTYMSDPRVADVFENLGFDAAGGVIASDEQVMLVAAPVAVAYGIDVDRFAVALYQEAKGWRGAAAQIASEIRSFCLGEGQVYGDAPNGCTIPVNGWWLQWVDLSRTAFRLAETWEREKSVELGSLETLSTALDGFKLPTMPKGF